MIVILAETVLSSRVVVGCS